MVVLETVSLSFETKGRRQVIFDKLVGMLPTNKRFIILGAPGSGKSILIKMVAGLIRPDSGSIERMARLSYPVGFGAWFRPKLTVKQNLGYAADVYEVDRDELIEFVGEVTRLRYCFSMKYGELPPLMRAQLHYATSYAIPFDTYLIDGLIGAGDEEFRLTCTSMFEARGAEGGTIRAPRHIQHAKKYGDCGALLSNGKLTFFDDVNLLVQAYRESKTEVQD